MCTTNVQFFPFFDGELRELKLRLKKLRKKVFRMRRRKQASLSDVERDYSKLRTEYGKLYDTKKNTFLRELEQRTAESLDAKHLMTSLKRVSGKCYSEIPVIVPGDGSKPNSFPKSKHESLNNLANEFSKVGVNSTRSSEYSEKYPRMKSQTVDEFLKLLTTDFDDTQKMAKEDGRFNISEEQIEEIIENLDESACGPDEIPVIFLKKNISACSVIISYIVRMSLFQGSLPKQFLQSNITPIVKDPEKSKNFFTNWRPISLTSIVARVCERAISVILLDEIERNGGLRDIQFGARKGMGCREALTYALLGVNKAVLENGVCHGVFMDVSKAFDRVDPILLARKLLDFAINKVLVRWILAFLMIEQETSSENRRGHI